MNAITNTRELYARIESIRTWEAMLQEFIAEDKESHLTNLERKIDINHIMEHIAEMKRTVRKWYKDNKFSFDDSPRLVQSDWDSAITLIPLPTRIHDRETAKEWFEYNEYMDRPNSPYDCTGEMFTAWYKLIERNGRWYAYHSFHLDV